MGFVPWVNVSGHVITTELATPISELKPLKVMRPWILGKLSRSFRPADWYKKLVMTRWVYNTVWTSSSARMSFPGTLKLQKFQNVERGLHSFEPRLKIPRVYVLVPRRGEKPVVFLILQFGLILPYFNTFCTSYGAQWLHNNYRIC